MSKDFLNGANTSFYETKKGTIIWKLEIPWYFNFSNLPLKGSAKFSFFRKILSFASEFSFHLEQYR